MDRYLDRTEFELIQMDTDSLYIAISGASINDIVRPKLRKEYDNGRKTEFLSTSKYYDRMPGLFKAEFQGTRVITLMSKCYYAERAKSQTKFSCKGIIKKPHVLGEISQSSQQKHRLGKEYRLPIAQPQNRDLHPG